MTCGENVHQCGMNGWKGCIIQDVLRWFRAGGTCCSGVVACVLFLERLRCFEFRECGVHGVHVVRLGVWFRIRFRGSF